MNRPGILARTISDGHALMKHADEFGKLSRDEFRAKIVRTLSNPVVILEIAEERKVF